MSKRLLFILILFFSTYSYSKTNIDSLWTVLSSAKKIDSTYISNFVKWSHQNYYYHPDSFINNYDKYKLELLINEELKNLLYYGLGMAKYRTKEDSSEFLPIYREVYKITKNNQDTALFCTVAGSLAHFYYETSNTALCVKYHNEIIDHLENSSSEYILDKGKALIRIGNAFNASGNYKSSQRHFQEALEIFQKINNKKWQSYALGNLGNAFRALEMDSMAKIYHLASIKIKEELNDIRGLGTGYNNYGNIFIGKNLDSAIYYLEKSLFYKKQIKSELYTASSYHNLGEVFLEQKDYLKSKAYFDSSLVLRREKNNIIGIASSLAGYGRTLIGLGDYSGIDTCLLALKLTRQIKSTGKELSALSSLSSAYAEIKDFQNAYKYKSKQTELKDSIFKSDLTETLAELRTIYELDQQDKELELLEEKQKVSEEQSAKRTLVIAGISLILLISLIAVYQRMEVKRKANNILKDKNNQLEKTSKLLKDSQEEILSSISYAKRIQDTMLTSTDFFKKEFSNYGLFYSPRDIVSGDFYWGSIVKGKKIVVLADSTGHGVPGAFMSLIGIKLLNEIVNQKEIISPNQILNNLNKGLIKDLSKSRQEQIKDAMDISVLVLDEENKTIELSGACHKMILIGEKVEVIPMDRVPLGNSGVEGHKYTSQKIQVHEGNKVVLFSDGIIDQFGGENNQKYKLKRLVSAIETNKELNSEELVMFIENNFKTWKGDYDQLDDICVISISF